jgi:hypothetical protein
MGTVREPKRSGMSVVGSRYQKTDNMGSYYNDVFLYTIYLLHSIYVHNMRHNSPYSDSTFLADSYGPTNEPTVRDWGNLIT